LSALQAATTTGAKFTICFNCVGSHSFKQCPKPADQARIKANKKIFRDQRKTKANSPGPKTKKPAGTGKFSPPTEEEKKNKNQRMIDGKLYFFHYRSKRWQLVKDSPAAGPSTTLANTAAANNAMATLADNPPGTLTPIISNQTRDLAIANAARQIESTFQGLLTQFSSQS
jgi:hypothetical protein